MKNKFLSAIFVSCLLTVGVTGSAFAHALWIEKNKDGATVFFGEYGEGLREKTGGKLDEITHLEAWSVGADGQKTVLTPNKIEDRFVLETKGPNVLAQDVSLPVKDMQKYKLGIAKPNLYARVAGDASVDLKPVLLLDIVPSKENPGKLRVYFGGKPLAKEKAVWIAPNGWMKELKTDEEGWLKAEQPWPGVYVMEVTHVVESPGKFEGKDYEVERHRATLSLEKA